MRVARLSIWPGSESRKPPKWSAERRASERAHGASQAPAGRRHRPGFTGAQAPSADRRSAPSLDERETLAKLGEQMSRENDDTCVGLHGNCGPIRWRGDVRFSHRHPEVPTRSTGLEGRRPATRGLNASEPGTLCGSVDSCGSRAPGAKSAFHLRQGNEMVIAGAE